MRPPVTITGAHGRIELDVARPAGDGPYPVVLIVHEGLGVTPHLHALVGRFAAAGYLAVAPNLYTRDPVRRSFDPEAVIRFAPLAQAAEREAAIAALPSGERATARQVATWFADRNLSSAIPDLLETLTWIAGQPDASIDQVAAIGFSQGGAQVAQLALAGAALAAGVIFYGTLPTPEQASRLRIPLHGHFASDDPQVNQRIAPFSAAAKAAGFGFTHVIHAGTAHGFFNESRPSYAPEASQQAWVATLAFLARVLPAHPVAIGSLVPPAPIRQPSNIR
ncbi:carboxymethylenebutenolidase [Planctomycetota bacterium]|nr:carboxymethylenebutenolidase [Planctomycetota bacterium]